MNMEYKEDILKNGFEQTIIHQPSDYEGEVIATLIRKQGIAASTKAVLYIHGFNDYFFQEQLADEFIKNGFHFYALDLRKYGRSILTNQKKNNLRSLSEYYPDIDEALSIIKKEGNKEVVLFGHSTGALIITLYAKVRKEKSLFDALICNSPFYDFNGPLFQKKTLLPMLSLLGRLNPDLALPIGFSKFYGKSLHTSEFGEWDYNLLWKPHLAHSINAGWVSAIHQAHLQFSKGISISKPILILHSAKSVYLSKWSDEMFEGDAILSVKDIVEKSKLIQSPNKELVCFKGGIHDLILSKKLVRDSVYKTIFEWLDKNLNL